MGGEGKILENFEEFSVSVEEGSIDRSRRRIRWIRREILFLLEDEIDIVLKIFFFFVYRRVKIIEEYSRRRNY